MSLRHFHIFFIFMSLLLCAGFSYWCFALSIDSGALTQTMGICSGVLTLGLVAYGRWFIGKENA